MKSITCLLITFCAVLTFGCPMVMALADKENGGRWNTPTTNGPDSEVPGFLVNLGPTGARAVLTDKTFIVRYIFKDSPAVDRLMLGDEILGAFGKPFSSTFFNGIWGPHHGYEGPIMELGEAIERAEGKDGKLVLNVSRGTKLIDVKIDLVPIGSFSPTFPIKCKKSEIIRANALKYLIDHPVPPGRSHERTAITLALLTSDDPKQQAIGKQMALAWNGQSPSAGTWTWDLSYQLITLSEYHLLTNDVSVLPMIKTLVEYLNKAQYYGKINLLLEEEPELYKKFPKDVVEAANQILDGGFSHTPYVPIHYIPPPGGANRNGPNLYGPMTYPTNLAVTAWQLSGRCGATLNPDNVKRAMQFIHRATTASGAVHYGMQFFFDPNGKIGLDASKDFQTWNVDYAFIGRSSIAFIAHKMSPEFPDSSDYMAKYSGFLKGTFKKLPDGHADANLGLFWTLMAAGSAEDETLLRVTLDYHKAFFNMMRCFDGSFVLLPSRSGEHDLGYTLSPRLHPTATMVITYGLNNPKLRLQGVSVSIPGINPKDLRGPLHLAYKKIEEKSYADSIKLIRTVRVVKKQSAENIAVCDALTGFVQAQLQKRLADLESLEKKGDFLGLQTSFIQTRALFGQLDTFKEKVKYFEDGLSSAPWKAEIQIATKYAQIVASLKRRQSKATVLELDEFAKKNPDSLYGKWALSVVEEFRAHGVVIDPSSG